MCKIQKVKEGDRIRAYDTSDTSGNTYCEGIVIVPIMNDGSIQIRPTIMVTRGKKQRCSSRGIRISSKCTISILTPSHTISERRTQVEELLCSTVLPRQILIPFLALCDGYGDVLSKYRAHLLSECEAHDLILDPAHVRDMSKQAVLKIYALLQIVGYTPSEWHDWVSMMIPKAEEDSGQ